MGIIRVLDETRIETLLQTSIVGRIACSDHGLLGGDGRPYLVPLAYGYDGQAIYAFSAPGLKIRIMRVQPLVTFEVDRVDAEDCWESVIAEATYEEITDATARERALDIIARGGRRPDIDRGTIVYALRITAKSGREEIPDPPKTP
jgi:nitroimidazol reductase NimA-like FMN-containing flavoprotein (pyridoxamine 5'-phosphate oxidase superfamily)